MTIRHIMTTGVCILALVLSIGIQPGWAQDEASENVFTRFTDTFDGYLKNATATRFDELDKFVKIENSLQLQYSSWLTDSLGVTLTGLAIYDAVYDVDDDLEVEDEDEYRASVHLREAFVDMTLDKVDLRLGKQQVVWGKTDGLRVTDVVNPLDLKEFTLGEFIDSRIPLWIAKIDYYFSFDFSLQALIIPEMQFLELAHEGSEYALNTMPDIPEGVTPTIYDIEEPDESFENTEYGLKFTGYYEGWDFTLNYLYTWDDEPVVKKTLAPQAGTLTIAPEHERLHIAGGTFATVMLDAVVRGELATRIGKYFQVDDASVPDMVTDKTMLSYAFAFERDLFDVTWLLQFFQDVILDYEDTIVDDEVDSKITLRGSKKFRNDTLEVAASIIYGVNDEESLIRPYTEYAINDSTKIKLGADLFEGGDEDSFFGQFDDRDRVYVEVKYSF